MTTHTPTPPTDDELRALLAPLAADEPTHAQRAALRRELADAPGATRRSWRPVLALAATTAAVGTGLSLLPAGDGPHRGATTAGSHPSILHAAAAEAAGEPVPSVADAPYRYAKLKDSFVYTATRDGRVAQEQEDQLSETWVGARWTGRHRFAQGTRHLEGDQALGADVFRGDDAFLKPRDGAYAYGDGPLAELDPADLPADRDGISRMLRDGIDNNRWSPYPGSRGKPKAPGTAPTDSFVTYSILGLLTVARVTPEQRAAMLDVLSSDPAARDLGTVKDAEGREGRGVALHYPGRQFLFGANRFEVIFDPGSSEILQWSMAPETPNRSTPARTETVLASGYVGRIGDRP